MLDIITNIQQHIDKGNITAGLFVDLQKAFDTVHVPTLIKKLEKLGVRGAALDLFSSYLTNRKQYVQIGEAKSNVVNISYGVPQGSILGPLLFNIYINDITKQNFEGDIRLYADDTCIFYFSKNIDHLIHSMQRDLSKLELWLKDNKLSLNIGKTKYIIMTSRQKSIPSTTLYFNAQKIEKVNNIKYLGLVIDSNLNWNAHIQYVIKKINPLVAMFKQVSFILTNSTRRSLYFAHIHSRLIYMLPVWGATTKANLGFLQVIQNRAIRRLYGFANSHSIKSIYNKCNILNLGQLLKYESIITVYKIMHYKLESNLTLTQNLSIYSYNTRQRNNFFLQPFNTLYGKNCFLYYALKLFNFLPSQAKSYTTLSSFKKYVKDFIFKVPDV